MTSPIRLDLVADGALQLTLERALHPLAERWIPEGLGEARGGSRRPVIAVHASAMPLQRPPGPRTLLLGSVSAWVGKDRAILAGAAPASGGVLSLGAGRGSLQVDPARPAGAAVDLYSMLTVSAGLLLAALEAGGRALVHAAAVVAPAGDAWLLAGDARSGKSTTCATLAAAGWGYLSDDQVVLTGRAYSVEVEGWLRPFHLDDATGARREIAAAELGLAGRWRRTARLAGVIFPAVSPTEPTLLTPLAPASALARLVRQTPWLLADRRSARGVLALLKRAVHAGAFSLRLGRDTYREPERLAEVLAPRSPLRNVGLTPAPLTGSSPPVPLSGSSPPVPLSTYVERGDQ